MNPLTCEECGAEIPDGAAVCRACGAPVEVEEIEESPQVNGNSDSTIDPPAPVWNQPPPVPSEPLQSDVVLQPVSVWNPWYVTAFGFLGGHLVSTAMIALNWRAKRKLGFEVLAWLTGGFYLWFVHRDLVASFGNTVGGGLGTLAWLAVVALPQIIHFQEHRDSVRYDRKWLLPVAVAVAVNIAALGWMMSAATAELQGTETLQQTNQAQPQTAAQTTSTDPVEATPQQVFEAWGDYVLPIQVTWTQTKWFISSEKRVSSGSAVCIWAEPGMLTFITNRHVVEPPEGAWDVETSIVNLHGYHSVDVSAVHASGLDLAVVKVRVPEVKESFKMPWFLASELTVGQRCVAIGNALGAGISMTDGVVSRFDEMGGWTAIRTSAPISPGNSGGALFSLKEGRLIGITTMSYEADGAQNINFVIPADYLSDPNAWVSPPWIGK